MRKLNYFCINKIAFHPIIPPHNPDYYEEDEEYDPYYYDDEEEDEEYDVALKTNYSSVTIPSKKTLTLTVV